MCVDVFFMLVYELIDDLKKFNPEAKIINEISISWNADDGCDEESKLTADKIWIFDESYGEEVF